MTVQQTALIINVKTSFKTSVCNARLVETISIWEICLV